MQHTLGHALQNLNLNARKSRSIRSKRIALFKFLQQQRKKTSRNVQSLHRRPHLGQDFESHDCSSSYLRKDLLSQCWSRRWAHKLHDFCKNYNINSPLFINLIAGGNKYILEQANIYSKPDTFNLSTVLLIFYHAYSIPEYQQQVKKIKQEHKTPPRYEYLYK